ncbi:MAG: hypothetical protein KJO63_14735 [Maribacter sp.]|nr:hypothetical protein [Maribacter sp.]
MKKTLVLLGLLVLHFGLLNAQYVAKNPAELVQLKKLPLEKVYVHYNTGVLFPGEYLYYSLYTFNAATNKLSSISKMAYVELVGEDLTTVFKQKVTLDKGRGQGDLFIPVSIPSGNYKLIGYTHWMKNEGVSQLFQDDIIIVNPYRTDQENILDDSEGKIEDSDQIDVASEGDTAQTNDDGTLMLFTDKKIYGQREKVTLTSKNYKGPLGYGDYSLSVRLKEDMIRNAPLSSEAYAKSFFNVAKRITNSMEDSIFLPEQRGELFFGQVRTREDQMAAIGKSVIISIPGDNFQLKSAITDADGNFYTYINKAYDTPNILAQVLSENEEAYSIRFSKTATIDYDALKFSDLTISQDIQDRILKRSVHNQIENAYYGVKPDSIISVDKKDPFDGGAPEVFILDDYTRFKTLRETLVEIVSNVWVKKLADGKYTFWVREDMESYDNAYATDPPLVLVDGVFVPKHNDLLDYNAHNIEKLTILRDPLVMGSKKYHGMVVIKTIAGNYLETVPKTNFASSTLAIPAAKKNYFKQHYDPENAIKTDRVPDFRYQLLWEPQISMQDGEEVFEFYSSDVPGEYEIVLEGFTSYGKPISIRESFVVE